MFQSTSIDNSNPRQLELSFRFPSEFDFQGFYSNCIFHNFMHLFTARGLSIDIVCIFYHWIILFYHYYFLNVCINSTSIIKDITLSVKRTSEWLVLRVARHCYTTRSNFERFRVLWVPQELLVFLFCFCTIHLASCDNNLLFFSLFESPWP